MEERQGPNIVECLERPEIFGRAFPEKSWGRWKTFLKAMYGIPFENEDELKFFQEATGRDAQNSNGYTETYGIIGSRGGKSRIASLCAIYEALFGGWPERLAPGEIGWCTIVATDVDQAKNIFRYCKALLDLFPENLVVKKTEDEIILKNNVGISCRPAQYRGLRGYTQVFICLDELAYFRSDYSANPAEEIVISLLPRLKDGGKLLGISTPAWKTGYLYQAYKSFWGDQDINSESMVWKKSTKEMNPVFKQKLIDRFLKKDKKYSTEFSADWRSEDEAFLTEEMVSAAMVHNSLSYDAEKKYFCGIDASGGRSDSMTMALSFQNPDGKIIVARAEEKKAPFNPEEVVREFSEIMKAYRVFDCVGDSYGAEWVVSMFGKYGIRLKNSEKNRSECYLETQSLFSCNRLNIPKDEILLAQFCNLERRPSKMGGRDQVNHPVGLKDDKCNAVALAACLANHPWLTKQQQEEKLKGIIVQAGPASRIIERAKSDFERQAEILARAEKDFGKQMIDETCEKKNELERGFWKCPKRDDLK